MFQMTLMTLLMIILFSCMSSSTSQRVAWLEAHLKANSTTAWQDQLPKTHIRTRLSLIESSRTFLLGLAVAKCDVDDDTHENKIIINNVIRIIRNVFTIHAMQRHGAPGGFLLGLAVAPVRTRQTKATRLHSFIKSVMSLF